MNVALAEKNMYRASDEACDESIFNAPKGSSSAASVRGKACHAAKIFTLPRQALVQFEEGFGQGKGFNTEEAFQAEGSKRRPGRAKELTRPLELLPGPTGQEEVNRVKVLLALHDPAIIQAISRALAGKGLQLNFCFTLGEAVEQLAKVPPNLIFCQARLPDGSFRDLLRHVDPERTRIPIVVCADFYDKTTYVESMTLGAHDYMAFPYRREQAEWIIEQVLRKASRASRKRSTQAARGEQAAAGLHS